MNSHLEYLEQWFCETSIGCVPKVKIITGLLIVFQVSTLQVDTAFAPSE